MVSDYITLTKPSVMSLVVFTGGTALLVEGSLLSRPFEFALVLIALWLTGGSANALNQYLERDIDARMSRTSGRRPLPQGRIQPGAALLFAITIGVIGVAMFAYFFNWLAAGLSLATLLFYSFVYTLYLKPNTAQNIVIGGIAGAMAPVGAWAAASGHMALTPWLLFLIVFLWTPPHFWALALFCKDDYVKAKLPMMPVIKGERSTLNQILVYSIILVITSFSFAFIGAGWIYLVSALVLGVLLIKKSLAARAAQTDKEYRGLFGYSIIYLFLLFIFYLVDFFVLGAMA